MILRKTLYSICLSALILAASCSQRGELEKIAMKRLPIALEKAMEDQMSLKGGAKIQSPETIFQCDSLCIIHFQAVTNDSSGKEFSFPVRYIFLHDKFMSAAQGHPVYSEKVTGSPTMSRDEVEKLKKYCQENSNSLYIYYAGTATPIESDNL